MIQKVLLLFVLYSLKYDWFTDAVIWLHNKIAPFQYLTQWSGRTP